MLDSNLAFLSLLCLCSCSRNNVESDLKTIVSDQQIAARFKLVNSKFTQEQLCLDWKTAIGIIALVEPPRSSSGTIISSEEQFDLTRNCPQSYVELAQGIRKVIRKENDFHAEISPGFSLNSRSGPVVTSCSGGLECDDIIGSQVLPLSSDTVYVYAMIQGRTSDIVLRLEEVNRQRVNVLKQGDSSLAPVHGANTQDFASHLLERKVLEGGNFRDLLLSAKSIRTSNMLRIETSYQPSQTVYSSRDDLELEKLSYSKEAFHCKNVVYDKDDSFACLTTNGTPVLRISAWNGYSSEILRSLDGKISSGSSIVIDVRGNTGGSTLDATEFLCSMGAEGIYDKMDRTVLTSSLIENRNVTLSSEKTVDVLSLVKSGNVGLLRFGESLNSISFPIIRKTYEVTWLQRHDFTMRTCRDKGLKTMLDRKWVVLTNGREFSATENFLALIKDEKTVKIIGRGSMGGTGNPVLFELPETKMKVTLSTSRMKIGNDEVIEGKGVVPDVRLKDYEVDTPLLFESRIQWFMNHTQGNMPIVPAIETALREASDPLVMAH